MVGAKQGVLVRNEPQVKPQPRSQIRIKQGMSARANINLKCPQRKQQYTYSDIMFSKKAYTLKNTHGTHQSGSTDVHTTRRGNEIKRGRKKKRKTQAACAGVHNNNPP